MICVSIGNVPLDRAEQLGHTHELVEYRLDLLPVNTIEDLDRLLQANRNAIVTYRPISGMNRDPFFSHALEAGVAYIDLEIEGDNHWLKDLISAATDNSTAVILSHHNYRCTPETIQLDEIRETAFDLGASICKIATHCRDTRDAARLIGLLNREPETLVVLGMGPAGTITRIAGPKLGAPFTFAFPDGEKATAPGQLSVSTMKHIFQHLENPVD